MNEINISGRLIGEGHPPLIIAELGINHNGSIKTAKQMVDSAFRCGVEVIKHQTHIVDDEMSNAAKGVIPGNTKKSIYKIMEECALSEEDEIDLKQYIESKGMIFISTPFSRAAANRLNKMGVKAFKIGSGECNNYPLLRHVAKFGKPIILSTGMNTITGIAKAVSIFESYNIPYALLHTTNLYPTPPSLVRLGAMVELKQEFPSAVIGLSDHTTNNISCIGAVALGASILERHFTDSMDRQGPDIVCSMDEEQCRNLINDTYTLHLELGGKKGPTEEEKITMNFAFATVVAIQDIKKGDKLNKNNIWVKRPACGEISAENYDDILGKVASVDIINDSHLNYSDII